MIRSLPKTRVRRGIPVRPKVSRRKTTGVMSTGAGKMEWDKEGEGMGKVR